MDKRYDEITYCSLSKTRELVISKNEEDCYVLAKRTIVYDEDGKKSIFFEKGATIIKPEYKDNFKDFLEKVLQSLK